MPGPWEQFDPKADSGPWTQYAAPAKPVAPRAPPPKADSGPWTQYAAPAKPVAPRAPPPKAQAKPADKSYLQRTLETVEGIPAAIGSEVSGIVKSFTPDPALKARANADFAARKKAIEARNPVERLLADYAPGYVASEDKSGGVFHGQVGAAARQLGQDFATPLDKKKGALALPARIGKVVLDALNVPTSAATGTIASTIGDLPERYAGVSRDAVSNLPLILEGGAGALKGALKGARNLAADASVLGKGPKLARALAKSAEPFKPVPKQLVGLARITRPEFVDESSRAAAQVLSKTLARTDLTKQQHFERLKPLYREFANTSEEEEDDFKRVIEGLEPQLPLSPGVAAAVPKVRNLLAMAGADLKNATGVELKPNYFPHNWQKPGLPADARPVPGVAKVGSGKQIKKRTLATLDEGRAQEFKEVHTHPLDAVAHYLEDVYNRIGQERSLKALRDERHAKFFAEDRIPSGYVKLEGPSTTKPARPILRSVGGEKIYQGQLPRRVLAAPESVARLHNNRVAKGLEASVVRGPYKLAKAMTNAAKTTVLGFGALAHTGLTSGKGVASELGQAANNLARGNFTEAGKAAVRSLHAPYTLVKEGGVAKQELLASGPKADWAKLYIDAGGRIGGAASYETSLRPNFVESGLRGTFDRDLATAIIKIGGGTEATRFERLREAADLFSKTTESAAHWTFKVQVPKIKLGAAKREIEQFLRDNPNASEAYKSQQARKIVNSIDSRFGEVVKDNNFWHPYYDQISRLLLLSPSWVQGNIRLFGDAARNIPDSAKSLARGKGVDVDTQALFGVYASRTLIAGLITYAATGEVPKGTDWVAPRTGGKNSDGSAERMTVLSSAKDVDQLLYGNSLPQEAFGKLNPALQLGEELTTNHDYFGRPIYRPFGVTERPGDPSRVSSVAGAVAGLGPIGLQSRNNPQSRIPSAAGFLGVQPAGQKFADPEKFARNQDYFGRKAFDAKLRADRKAAALSASTPAEDRQSDKGPWSNYSSAQPAEDRQSEKGPWSNYSSAQPAVKTGAANAGDIRPETKKALDFVSTLPFFNRVTAENDSYHPASDVHGQGRAFDFTVKGGKAAAASAAAEVRKQLAAQGFKVQVLDEYNNPSRNATGGHIHVRIG